MNSHPAHPLPLLREQAYINGQWLTGAQQFAVHNPASGAYCWVADLGAAETCAAVRPPAPPCPAGGR
jgi:succinate-semialdehyde dehydrogenase/glutarate-semialdehyde dehydrogenase